MKQINKDTFGLWVITGASSGVGKEFAQQVAASGINVMLPELTGTPVIEHFGLNTISLPMKPMSVTISSLGVRTAKR